MHELYRHALHNQSASLNVIHKVKPASVLKNVKAVNRSKLNTKMEPARNKSKKTGSTTIEITRFTATYPRKQEKGHFSTSSLGIDWNKVIISGLNETSLHRKIVTIAPDAKKLPKVAAVSKTGITNATSLWNKTTTIPTRLNPKLFNDKKVKTK